MCSKVQEGCRLLPRKGGCCSGTHPVAISQQRKEESRLGSGGCGEASQLPGGLSHCSHLWWSLPGPGCSCGSLHTGKEDTYCPWPTSKY
ncbi:rCG47895 [Rattus norvegicus]|uniref:RCG47895 n=1 Tax=Rattus norvegicus TaxID=10116 RepID=A6HWV0_RAT|nr:rCG47895 [Rattus norvegicus]